MNVLVANIGSTSFKYRVLDTGNGKVLSEGRVERIGHPGSACPDYDTAIRQCLNNLQAELHAVGFKAVLAGPLSGARLVDEEVLSAMEEYAFFAPAHNPPYIAAMKGFQKALPDLPLVALFETAFFDAMPESATTYAVPYAWKQDFGIRRYGFHGASHRAASEYVLQHRANEPKLRHISCHLGGSSSLAAIRGGVAIDCSFGMSPQSGLPQNNRSGDLDSFAVLFVMKRLGLSIDQMAEILASKSGLAGISGTTGDVRDLNEAIAAGSAQARLALDVYIRAIRRYLGAFLVGLGGLDVLTFSGGIGENSAEVREAVCAGLHEFGIDLDEQANRVARGECRISTGNSRVAILVVPADEERIVARATAALIQSQSC
jgi:acetate kinase